MKHASRISKGSRRNLQPATERFSFVRLTGKEVRRFIGFPSPGFCRQAREQPGKIKLQQNPQKNYALSLHGTIGRPSIQIKFLAWPGKANREIGVPGVGTNFISPNGQVRT
jgi:hypothetical protein